MLTVARFRSLSYDVIVQLNNLRGYAFPSQGSVNEPRLHDKRSGVRHMTTTAAQDTKTASERVSLTYIRIGFLCAIVMAFDGFDITAMGFVIPPLTKAWGISAAQFTPALVTGSVGMFFGALVAGVAGDYFGRRPVFIICVTFFGF